MKDLRTREVLLQGHVKDRLYVLQTDAGTQITLTTTIYQTLSSLFNSRTHWRMYFISNLTLSFGPLQPLFQIVYY